MIRPRQGRTAVAVLAIAAFAAVVVWFGILKEPRPPAPNAPEARAPVSTAPSPAPAPGLGDGARTPSPPAGGAEPPRNASASAPPPPESAPGDLPRQAAAPVEPPREAAGPLAPSFDVVRVEPSGDAVIAGRAVPGATIDLLRNGTSHARASADQSGLFALVPPPLPPGSHEIVLQSIAPDGTRTRSRDSITIVIADDKATKPLVALASPDRPTVLLSNPDRPSPPGEPAPPRGPDVAAAPAPAPGTPSDPPATRPDAPAPAPAPAPRPSVRIAAIDAEEGGRLFVSGQAAPGATVRLYLNDTLIAPGGAGADGKVAFAISRGVRPGGYRVRLDDVDPVSGEVRSRAEVQFAMPAQVAVPLPPHVPPLVTGPQDVAGLAPAPAPTPAPAAPDPGHAPGQGAAPAGPGSAPARAEWPASPSAARTAAPSAGERQAAERAIAAGTVLIPEINTAIVARGDNLWNISRRIYGQGLRYTVIYGANQPQIRNPDLIYPGQVFVLPPEQAQAPRL